MPHCDRHSDLVAALALPNTGIASHTWEWVQECNPLCGYTPVDIPHEDIEAEAEAAAQAAAEAEAAAWAQAEIEAAQAAAAEAAAQAAAEALAAQAAAEAAAAEAAAEAAQAAAEAAAQAAAEGPPALEAAAAQEALEAAEEEAREAEEAEEEAARAAEVAGENLAAVRRSPAAAVRPPENVGPQVFGVAWDARIQIAVVEETWVVITVGDGNQIFSGTVRPGDTILIPDREDVFMTAGNAKALNILVDGTRVPPTNSNQPMAVNVSLAVGALLGLEFLADVEKEPNRIMVREVR